MFLDWVLAPLSIPEISGLSMYFLQVSLIEASFSNTNYQTLWQYFLNVFDWNILLRSSAYHCEPTRPFVFHIRSNKCIYHSLILISWKVFGFCWHTETNHGGLCVALCVFFFRYCCYCDFFYSSDMLEINISVFTFCYLLP